jgi:hypothetical protein
MKSYRSWQTFDVGERLAILIHMTHPSTVEEGFEWRVLHIKCATVARAVNTIKYSGSVGWLLSHCQPKVLSR